MLSESQVQSSFSNLFRGGNCSDEQFEQAEQLIDELRPESPLRTKLTNELEEIRQVNSTAN